MNYVRLLRTYRPAANGEIRANDHYRVTPNKYYGESLRVDVEGRSLDLRGVADDLFMRLAGLFLRDPETGCRLVLGDNELMQNNELWKEMIPFHEFFHGEDGSGLGASHQTGWTAMVAVLLDRMGRE